VFKRILFIGLGGAGQRHLRLFKENSSDETELIAYRSRNQTPTLNPDFTVNSGNTLEELYGVKIYNSLDDAIDSSPDLAVIATPSSMHMKYAQLCANNGINIFVEKPLSDSHEGLNNLYKTILNKKIFFQVGFQRRYHPHLNEINNIIKSNGIGAITNSIMTVASYIPFWHPYEDFRDLYACRKELGGGVLLTEIHEFDLCIWYFGKPKSVTCVGGTYSKVGLDVEDTVHVTLNYVTFAVQVNLTFWQKHAERSIFIAGEDGSLFWNQDGNTLQIENYNNQDIEIKKSENFTNDLMFELQIQDIISNQSQDSSSTNLLNSSISLSIVLAAKKSMEENRTISLSQINTGIYE